MRGSGEVWRSALVALTTAFLWITAAQACVAPNMLTDDRPNADAGPTELRLGIGVADVLAVDDVNQELDLDLFINMSWEDPRLADLDGCRFSVTEVWFPEIYILNSSNLTAKRRNARDEVSIENGGTVNYVNRLTGTVSSYHNLRHFPFDTQRFKIEVAVPNSQVDQIVLNPMPDKTWIATRLNVEGWTFRGASMSAKNTDLPALKETLSVATLELDAKRNPEYYIYRILLLLAIVVAMSWVIFWVPPERYEFQIGLGATAMLTSMAFNFSVASRLPPVGYLTVMDRLVIWAVLLVFLATVEALITARLADKKRVATAERIDVIARFVFPLAFAGGWFLIISVD